MLRAYLSIVSVLAFALAGVFVLADNSPAVAAPLDAGAEKPVEIKAAAEPKEASGDPLEGVSLTKMKLVDGRYREVLEDGRVVTFTVDPELQAYAEKVFEQYKVPAGAAVIMNSRTGRVLAMAQRRATLNFSPTDDVALDPTPPAASLFKIVTTAALLEQTEVSPKTKTCYWGGGSRLRMENLQDPPAGKGACVSLEAAFGRSVNSVYAILSDRRLKKGVIEQYAKKFYFNQQIPFDVPFEKSTADIPTERLERARTAAGFWHTHLSPLHAASIVQSIAQKGAMLRPYIVEKVESKDGALLHEASTKYLGHVVKKETALAMMNVMTYTVSRGTARKAFKDGRGVPYLPIVSVAGKTGTLNGKNPYRAYTWFAGAAPADNPEVSIAVLVVNDPKWRIKAPGAAALLLKKYFELKK